MRSKYPTTALSEPYKNSFKNKYLYVLTFLSSFFFIFLTSHAFALGGQPAQKFELLGPAKECSERAWKKIRSTGREYNVDRRGYDEKTGLQNFWIGEWLFVLPKGYVADVGFGYRGDAPGISALLQLAMPDLTPQLKPGFALIEGVSPAVKIRISCNYFDNANLTVRHAASISREDLLRKYLLQKKKIIEYPLPEFGLRGYAYDGGSRVLYLPTDPKVTNPHGGALGIFCDWLYPLPQRAPPSPQCSIYYVYRDGVSIDFQFPEHYLKYWRVSYERLLFLLNSFLVEP